MTASVDTGPTLTTDNLDDSILEYIRTDAITVHYRQTIGEALASLRNKTGDYRILYVYAVDDDNRLVGVIPLRSLLLNGLDVRIEDIMVRQVVSIPSTATVMVACECFLLHKLLAFPVVDGEKRILGLVDVNLFTDEVIDMAERQTADDVFQLIGVRVAQARQQSPIKSFRARFPWLLSNITGGILCAILSGFYDGLLEAAVVLALFIPVVLALAESVSMQSMTLTIQQLHGRKSDFRTLFGELRRELFTAILLGIGAGFLVGLAGTLWRGGPVVGLAIGLSICLSMITACLLGVALPTIIRAFRGDPRVASGPLVLSSADILTLLFYFNLSGILLTRTSAV